MKINKFFATAVAASLILALPMHASAEEGTSKKKSSKTASKVYNEGEFIKLFSNKTRQQVTDVLGKPATMNQGRPPSDEEASMATLGQKAERNKKNDSIEMWYYKNIVRYDPKHTYSKIELTFVNDRCQNVAYFNEK